MPVLIRIARTNPDPELRKTALFWLGQSEDPRALDLFEEILKYPDRIIVDPDGAGGPASGQEIDDPNFSLVSLRGNAVLRWEYSAGSTLFLVWTQNRSDMETIGSFQTGQGIDRLFGASADNIFLVKVSYWWNP